MRRLTSTLLLVTLFLLVGSAAEAQDQPYRVTVDPTLYTAPEDTPPPPPMAAGNLLNSAPFDGESPLGITYNSTDDLLLVVDLFDGDAYLYETDLSATGDTVPCPRGPAGPAGWPVHTGVTFVSADASTDDDIEEDSYFWIALDVNATLTSLVFQCVQTDLDGTELNSVEFGTLSGAGNVVGFTYDDMNDTFWVNDSSRDLYFEFEWDPEDDEIIPTGRSFKHPLSSAYGARGNGLSHVSGTYCFDIPVGSLLDGQVVAIHRVDAGGGAAANPVAAAQALDVTLTADSFLNGNQYCAEGSDGGPVNYLVGNATDTIFEIELDRPCNECTIDGAPTAMEAFESALGTLTVTWDISDSTSVDSIEIVVDGEVEGTAEDVSDGTIDVTVGSGLHEVTLRYSDGTDSCDMATCTVPVSTEAAYSVAAPPLPGGVPMELFGVTVNERSDVLLFPDLFGGQTLLMNRDLEEPEFEFSPTTATAGETTTAWYGIAYLEGATEADDRYYWLTDNDLGAFQLIETDTDLDYMSQVDIDPPGGGPIYGMDLDAAGDGLILNDVGDDAYYLFNLDGSTQDDAAGDPISFPVPLTPVPAFLGNGVGTLPDGLGYGLPVAEIGTTAFNGPDQLILTDDVGEPLGCEYTIGPEPAGTHVVFGPFVNDLCFTTTGPDDADGTWVYVCENLLGLIFVFEVDCTPCRPVSALACTHDDGDVLLEWEVDEDDATAIEVYRGDTSIASLAGDATSYSDGSIVEYGDLEYTVMVDCDTGSSSTSCTVSAPDPDANVLVVDLEPDTGEIDSAGTVASILDSFEELTTTTLSDISALDLDQFDCVFVFCGTAPNIGAITTGEGEILSDWLLESVGNSLYVEGGDYAAAEIIVFLDNTDLHDNDGVTVDVLDGDGDRICPVSGITGLDTDVPSAPDLSDFSASHDCEGGFIDELMTSIDGGAAVIMESSDDDTHGLMVFHDGDESIGFTYRTIVSAIEMAALFDIEDGGSPMSLADLVERLYEALTDDDITLDIPDSPSFTRCDCDANDDFSALLDALFMMRYGFAGGDVPTCFQACDCDGGGTFSPLLDALRALQYFFAGGEIPPQPFLTCGEDTEGLSDDLSCEENPGCP